MKKQILILVILLLCVGNGCKKATTNNDMLANYIYALASNEFSGRLYNTEGNKAAFSYIIEQLTQLELEPLINDNMLVPFCAILPTDFSSKLTLHSPGQLCTLQENKDFYTPICGPENITGVLTEQYQEGENTVFRVENNNETVLFLSSSDFRGGWTGNLPGNNPLTISLTDSGVKKVEPFLGERISFESNSTLDEIELNNVIAVLPGKDRTKAVVLGAHFDHVGQTGDVIYSGAIDNASGVGAVLLVAEQLASTEPEVDIVFSFWNAEEHGLVGSQAGSKMVSEHYEEYCYINIDSIGYVSGGNIDITTANDSLTLCKKMEELLSGEGFTEVSAKNYYVTSDHVSFKECESINFTQNVDAVSTVIHHPSDNISQLDIEAIRNFSKALSSVLQNTSNVLVETKTEYESDKTITWPEGEYSKMDTHERAKYEAQLGKQLEYTEEIILKASGIDMVIRNLDANFFDTLEDAQKFYPNLMVQQKIGAYELSGITIYDSGAYTDSPVKYNQVVDWIPTYETISSINLYYSLDELIFQYRVFLSEDIADGWFEDCDEISNDSNVQMGRLYYREGMGYTYVTKDLSSNATIHIEIGDLCEDINGNKFFVSDNTITKEDFLSAAEPMAEVRELIMKET